MARELPVALVDTPCVLEMFVAVVLVGEYLTTSRALVAVTTVSCVHEADRTNMHIITIAVIMSLKSQLNISNGKLRQNNLCKYVATAAVRHQANKLLLANEWPIM
jgi:hypothetical protein